ncbi:hypothetical protein, partial [Streptomyces sp. S1]|uniref:hypothetical protein n=1 Tax=Streptomyces sp. S1 TaxID=718288 RepID=UPI003D716630
TTHPRRRRSPVHPITSDNLYTTLLERLPEVLPYVETAAARHDLRPADVTHWEQLNTHPGTLLSEVLAHPLFLPALSEDRDHDLLVRTFAFVEALLDSPGGYLEDTAYYTFIEPCLKTRETLGRAMTLALPRTRGELWKLAEAWNITPDPAWPR